MCNPKPLTLQASLVRPTLPSAKLVFFLLCSELVPDQGLVESIPSILPVQPATYTFSCASVPWFLVFGCQCCQTSAASSSCYSPKDFIVLGCRESFLSF